MKKLALFLICVILGAVVGHFVGSQLGDIAIFKWLTYGARLSTSSPVSVNLPMLSLVFEASFSITVANAIFMLLGAVIFAHISKRI